VTDNCTVVHSTSKPLTSTGLTLAGRCVLFAQGATLHLRRS